MQRKYIFRYDSGEGLSYNEVVMSTPETVEKDYEEWLWPLLTGGYSHIPDDQQDSYEVGDLEEGD